MNRRDFLSKSYLGLGGLALSAMAATTAPESPLQPKPQHLPAKAKRCIFLFMEGGVSQMDLFEYRPMLEKFAGKQIPKRIVTEESVFPMETAAKEFPKRKY